MPQIDARASDLFAATRLRIKEQPEATGGKYARGDTNGDLKHDDS
jgi:hypothetical protein